MATHTKNDRCNEIINVASKSVGAFRTLEPTLVPPSGVLKCGLRLKRQIVRGSEEGVGGGKCKY